MKRAEIMQDYKTLTVSSKAFQQAGHIPLKYTCDGENVSPPIDIQHIPESTQSLLLIIEDPDAPNGTWLHWLVWNIAPGHHISEGEIPGEQGLNDFGNVNYGGPCPPSGTHRYYFKMYALDNLLNLPEGSSRSTVEEAMADHVLAYGELMGRYKRRGG